MRSNMGDIPHLRPHVWGIAPTCPTLVFSRYFARQSQLGDMTHECPEWFRPFR